MKTKTTLLGLALLGVSPSLFAKHKPTITTIKPVDFEQSMQCNPHCEELLENSKMPLLRALYQNNNLGQAKVRSKPRIPKIIQQVWFGGQVPEKFHALQQSWQDHHPDWEYRLWTDSDIPGLKLHNQKLFDEAEDYAQQANIVRYEVLYRYGGVYVDMDFACFAPLDHLHYAYDFYVGISNEPVLVLNNAIVASKPRHFLMKACVFEKPVFWTKRLGPHYLTHQFFTTVNSQTRGVIALPCSYFYPLPFPVPENAAPLAFQKPESLGMHMWEGSWIVHEDNEA